jgi:hypothetical protein
MFERKKGVGREVGVYASGGLFPDYKAAQRAHFGTGISLPLLILRDLAFEFCAGK